MIQEHGYSRWVSEALASLTINWCHSSNRRRQACMPAIVILVGALAISKLSPPIWRPKWAGSRHVGSISFWSRYAEIHGRFCTDLARLRSSQRFYEANSFYSGWCSILITQFSVSRAHLVYRIGETQRENHLLRCQLCFVYYIVCRYPFLWSQFA